MTVAAVKSISYLFQESSNDPHSMVVLQWFVCEVLEDMKHI